MDSEKQNIFKRRLDDLEKEVRADLNRGGGATEAVQLDTSIGRLSRMDAMQSQQMALELKRRMETRLLRIENARKRMEKGTYGLCGKCGRPIAEERLEAQPDAVFCVKCAEGR